ncbi:ABC transporter permease [Corynebacterium mendelii]|uniref:ABC transporter permease n=1 Tax=Corynebacterium mendelii TaxID=2765362 RepID=A0A939IXM1_9CORY|nr:ABC transporter permease [Corynebacterium mendelii]MBN9643807.1 ABC transporter permease [Corynebacterium mendelii]
MSAAAAGTASKTNTKDVEAIRKRNKMWGINTLSLFLGLAIWWVLPYLGVVLPTPPEVLEKFIELCASGLWFSDVGASLARVFSGFILGTLLAIPVGFLMGWYSIARGLLEPWIQFFRTVPPLAMIPLVLVLMGIGEMPKIFVIFLAAFLSCVISTFQGVISVDKTLINAAKVLGAGDGRIFAKVVVPASTPFILVGMRIGLGSAWATVVAAELIASQGGLGYRMQNAQVYLDTATIMVSLITIGVFGLIMDRILLFAENKLTGWQERR